MNLFIKRKKKETEESWNVEEKTDSMWTSEKLKELLKRKLGLC